MDDETRANNINNIKISTHANSNLISSVDFDSSEPPAPKKRCLRTPSDVDSISDEGEDPALVSDSGFGDLPLCPSIHVVESSQDGDQEEGPYFDVVNHGGPLFGFGILNNNNNSTNCASVPVCVGTSVRTSSLDTLSLNTELNDFPDAEDEDDDDKEEEFNNSSACPAGQFLNNSTNSTDSVASSDQCYSSLNSESGNQSSTSEEDSVWDHIFKNKEIAENPSRLLMMQRFFSHLRSNPNDSQLQHFLSLLLSSPEFATPRQKLRHVTSMADAIRLFKCSKKILVLTGAGISVSCGIPDFRSKDGLYARVSKVFPHLRDPQSVFDIRLFKRDPRPFFLTAKELYPGQFEPSLSHKFIRNLETRDQLLRNYSQNIDTLEDIVGINKVTMCHGSFATATCIRCKHKVKADDIKEKVLAGDVPYCPSCSTEEETSQLQYPLGFSSTTEPQSPAGLHRKPSFDEDDEFSYTSDLLPIPPVLKPDIVFFGEDLPEEFHNNLEIDKHDCDLLLVIGSSLRVRPVSLIPGMLAPEVPQILINRESLPHCRFDIELLGNCDAIISQLCRHLGPDFEQLAAKTELQEVDKLPRSEAEAGQDEVKPPASEDDIQALKACWEPKVNENISEKLPENSYLNWRPRQYVFEGAEVLCDPDDDDEDDEDDSSSESDSSDSNDDAFENSKQEVTQHVSYSNSVIYPRVDDKTGTDQKLQDKSDN